MPAADCVAGIFSVIAMTLPETFGVGQIVALVLALLALLVSGFVSGSEIAFFSLTERQCEELEEMPGGDSAIRLVRMPERLLATILIANNLVNVTIVVLCNFALGPVFEGMSEVLSFILQSVILTFLILLFGEILPKLIANSDNMRWVRFSTGGVKLLTLLFMPLAAMLERSTIIVNKVVAKKDDDVTADDLSQALEITDVQAGEEKEMLEGILRFGDTTASEVMTPRVDMTSLDLEDSFEDVMKVVIEKGYSRLPVCDGSQDNIKGVLYSRDLLPYIGKAAADFDWHKLLRQPYFVPESRMIDDLLEDFRRRRIHMAIVVDEFGGTAGLVTLEDLVEEIFGDIQDEHDKNGITATEIEPGVYEFSGRIEVRSLRDEFRLDIPEDDEYQTLAGYIIHETGTLPAKDEKVEIDGITFIIKERSATRLDLVRVETASEEKGR